MPREKQRTELLKSELLTESLTLLNAEGPAAVTARRVASVAGTSTAAVYELFGSKSGLVRAIFYEGFEQLAERLDDITNTGDARADIAAIFETTRTFALQFPMLFEVMYARPFAEFEPEQADREAASRIYLHVTTAVAALLEARRNSQTVVDASHILVALDRGLIASELAGHLGGSKPSIERRRGAALDAVLTGLVAGNPPT